MDIKEKIGLVFPYNVVVLMLFYGCPLFMSDTGTAVLFLMVVIPVGVFFCGFVCGQKHGFQFLFVVISLICFVPQYWVLLHDREAWCAYAAMYTGFALAGLCTGWVVSKAVNRVLKRREEKHE